jgi:hypothetical protein
MALMEALMPDFSRHRANGLIHRPHSLLPRLTGAVLDDLPAFPVTNWHLWIAFDGDSLGNGPPANRGNCVECGALQSIRIRRAVVAGDHRVPKADQALALYQQWSGWDGTDATDLGTASDVAAVQWATKGIWWSDQWEDVPAIAWLDVKNLAHLRAAIRYLGPVQIDLVLPISAQKQDVWDVAADDGGVWGCHRVCCGRYDAERFNVVTWGVEQTMTGAFLLKYGINAEAAVSASWLDTTGRTPAGLDFAALKRESEALAV